MAASSVTLAEALGRMGPADASAGVETTVQVDPLSGSPQVWLIGPSK